MREYEEEFAQLVTAPQARAFMLGRMGLYVVLKALGAGPGDRVGVCGYGCLSVAEAVLRTGAECEFLDVDEWLNVSPESLAKLPAARIKALVTQYTFGIPSHVNEALRWAESAGVPVIEDCCHALGTRWKGKHVGSFGVAAIYSSQWGKSYSTGQGGMLTINDQNLAGKIDEFLGRESRSMSKASDLSLAAQRLLQASLVRPGTFPWFRNAYHLARRMGLIHRSLSRKLDFSNSQGFVRRAGQLLARAGLKQIRHWPRKMAARKENSQVIADALASVGAPQLDLPDEADCVLLRYPLRCRKKAALLQDAEELNANLAGWYNGPAHPLEGGRLEAVGYHGQCPNAEEAAASVVHLPTSMSIPPKRLKPVVRLIREHVNDR